MLFGCGTFFYIYTTMDNFAVAGVSQIFREPIVSSVFCGGGMKEIQVMVNTKVGLHARPAALFVQTAKQFSSRITIINAGKDANAKSILNVLALGVYHGTTVQIRAEGEDEDKAIAALLELIESNFGEPE